MSYFYDRKDASQKLSHILSEYLHCEDVIIVGLPRGGVVVAFEVAKFLRVPLDILVVKKIGCPGNPELAMGAVDDHGIASINESIISMIGISAEDFEKAKSEALKQAEARALSYRQAKKAIPVKDKTVILVDDGLATGATMMAAVSSMRKQGVSQLIVAVPVAAPDSLKKIQKVADKVFCLYAPDNFGSVGAFYSVFDQTEDRDVIRLVQNNK